jgi:hypothetical protein
MGWGAAGTATIAVRGSWWAGATGGKESLLGGALGMLLIILFIQ